MKYNLLISGSMLKKVLQFLIFFFTTCATVSAQNRSSLQFTIVSSEVGKSINEKSDYTRETTTTFSIRPAPTFHIETDHVLWSKEESPMAAFLKSKVGKSLHFDVAAVSGSYNATDVQNKGKRLSFSTHKSMTAAESDKWFGSSTLMRTATGGILTIFIPDFTVWAPWSGGDNQPSECLNYGSYGENGIQIALTNAELSKWEGVTKNWRGSCNIEDGYFSNDFSNSLSLQVQFNHSTVEKSSLQFIGCESVVVGQAAVLSAEGKPSAGTYRYWSESSAVSISGSGSEAKATGISPGKTTIWVEYTSPKGEKLKKSKTIHSIKVSSINNGNHLKLGLHDSKGKLKDALKVVPVRVEPSGEVTLLTFKPADNTVLSTTPTGQNQLKVQGLKKGKSTIQAYSDCGTKTGPLLEVEVANCDDEVVEEVRRQRKKLKSRLDNNLKQVAELLGSKEFAEAEKNGVKAIEAVEIGLQDLAISVTTAGVAQKILTRLSELRSLKSNVKDDRAVLTAWQIHIISMNDGKLKDYSALAKTLYEFSEAVGELSGYLGTLSGVADRLEELARQYEQTQREYLEVTRVLFKVCQREEEGEAEPEEKPKDEDAVKSKSSGKPNPPVKSKPLTASGEAGVKDGDKKSDKTNTETEIKDETRKPPNNPPNPPKKDSGKTGLWLSDNKDNCSCDTPESNSITINPPQGILGVKANMNDIKACFDGFNEYTLKPLIQDIKSIEAFYSELEAVSLLKKEDQEKKIDGLEASLNRTDGEKAEQRLLNIDKFKKSSGACPKKLQESIIQKLKINWDRLL